MTLPFLTTLSGSLLNRSAAFAPPACGAHTSRRAASDTAA
eukprot:CAMPEP_0173410122 /NCGR_PEP_ID=MMETSP1356-20130122/73861_1 /TAXON_ID=77927 ORGANISM="Hemiselmis virescens, Strain PCC157" /NCGR_SAMPLE_ID=MMETSP1356 /ASSEMBLY_ACC=CAM_ASM_000847 /LENGTH=39 /DNA_ID= /DNA_START= /DNA_END= /DNA_ORIENTATION=